MKAFIIGVLLGVVTVSLILFIISMLKASKKDISELNSLNKKADELIKRNKEVQLH